MGLHRAEGVHGSASVGSGWVPGLGVRLRVGIGAGGGVGWRVRYAYVGCWVIWGAHGGERMVCTCVGGLGVLQSIWGVRVVVQEG